MIQIDANAHNKTYLTISKEGVITLGPDITWDEAAELLIEALERQIEVRATAVRRSTDVQSEGRDGG